MLYDTNIHSGLKLRADWKVGEIGKSVGGLVLALPDSVSVILNKSICLSESHFFFLMCKILKLRITLSTVWFVRVTSTKHDNVSVVTPSTGSGCPAPLQVCEQRLLEAS